jgi:SAM-dependent methyltransferase
MDGWRPETYGDTIAGVYDEHYRGPDDGQVEFLASLAGDGAALELGIGTGRVALPLAATGVKVSGIDASARMVEQLRAKPGADAIDVTMGDFTDFDLGRRFSLVFVVFNTFFSLLTQDEQVQCFEAVTRHLEPGGRFVLQCFVPDLDRFDRGQRTSTTRLSAEEVRIDAATHDLCAQTVRNTHVIMREGEINLFPVVLRYAWPSELDLMARLAGLELEARYGGWHHDRLTDASAAHVSVYRRRSGGRR